MHQTHPKLRLMLVERVRKEAQTALPEDKAACKRETAKDFLLAQTGAAVVVY